MGDAAIGTLVINGTEYVVIPKAEYSRLVGGSRDAAATPALDFILVELGYDLRAAREHAGFTQGELAEKLGKSQSTVSGAEAGKIRVSAKYVRAVFKACRLPAKWRAPRGPFEVTFREHRRGETWKVTVAAPKGIAPALEQGPAKAEVAEVREAGSQTICQTWLRTRNGSWERTLGCPCVSKRARQREASNSDPIVRPRWL